MAASDYVCALPQRVARLSRLERRLPSAFLRKRARPRGPTSSSRETALSLPPKSRYKLPTDDVLATIGQLTVMLNLFVAIQLRWLLDQHEAKMAALKVAKAEAAKFESQVIELKGRLSAMAEVELKEQKRALHAGEAALTAEQQATSQVHMRAHMYMPMYMSMCMRTHMCMCALGVLACRCACV